jgi:hypothetical protein
MSFISVEPQSRVLLESHSDSLLAQFDTQRRIIASRYLAFFQERSVNHVPMPVPVNFTLMFQFQENYRGNLVSCHPISRMCRHVLELICPC